MDRLLRYCLFGVLFASSMTSFAATKTIIVEPSDLSRTYSAGPMAYSDSRSWDIVADVPAGKARPKVPVTTTRGWGFPKFRDGLKSAIKITPARVLESAALAAMFAAVDWVLDPANNTISKQNGLGTPAPTSQYMWKDPNYCPTGRATVSEAVDCVIASRSNGVYGYTLAPGSITAVNSTTKNIPFVFTPTSGGSSFTSGSTTIVLVGSCPVPYVLVGDDCRSDDAGLIPVTDPDIETFTSGITDPATAADIAPYLDQVPGSYDYPDTFTFDGPSSLTGEPVTTTSTDASTGTTTVTETTPSYSFDYSTNPLSITTTTTNTTTTYQNGVLIQTDVTTESPVATETQPDIPTDCDFMPTVCAFLEWFKTPAPLPDIDWKPIEQIDAYSPSLGTGGGSCPAPISVTTGFFGNIQVSYQPLCDFASILRFFTIGGALLFAIYINMGISRSTN